MKFLLQKIDQNTTKYYTLLIDLTFNYFLINVNDVNLILTFEYIFCYTKLFKLNCNEPRTNIILTKSIYKPKNIITIVFKTKKKHEM